jgi:hypothetical protein
MLIMGTAVRSLENVANRMDLSASQLGRLQETLANALPPSWEGPLTNRALAGERAMSLDYAGEYYMLLPEAWEAEPPEGVIPAISTAFPLLNLLGGNRFERAAFAGYYRLLQRITDEAVRTRNPTGVKCAERLKQDAHRSFLMPMADTFLPDFGFVIESELRIRTQLDLARTALAVERFRLANGRLPERLEDVVSAFLDRVPVDPWNGGKLVSYCVKENGEFVVYSYGKNKTDEKGEEMRDWWDKGDITFTVAPVAVRRQLQVAGAA